MHKNDSVYSRVKIILENVPYLRDNKPDFIKQYRFSFPTDTSTEETIARMWRRSQQYEPQLRWKEWFDRHKSMKKMQEKFRNLWQYEDCSNMFEPIKFEKETFFQSLLRKFF